MASGTTSLPVRSTFGQTMRTDSRGTSVGHGRPTSLENGAKLSNQTGGTAIRSRSPDTCSFGARRA